MILNIGVFQYKMRDESPFKKIQRLENHLKKNTTLDLIVCPELFISGYGSHKKIKEFAEIKDGEYAIKISALAKKYSTAYTFLLPLAYGDSGKERVNNTGFQLDDLFGDMEVAMVMPGISNDRAINKQVEAIQVAGVDSGWIITSI
jgi:predicted amidohydrolase